jgi:ABC-type transport system involved in multi-copper enzyme maturation permease subunit
MEMLKRKLVIWGALAHASILEAIRRKDIYVALILSAIMMLAAATIGTFGVNGLEMFLKDVALTVISLLSLVLAVLFAARQIPEEVSRRTVYPLLARPIGRGDLLFGKFLGAFTLSVIALLLFAAIGAGALAWYGLSLGAIFWQFLLLRIFALGLICAMTMALSLVMTPGATVTMSLLLAAGSATFSNAVLLLYGASGTGQQQLLKASYYIFPHLDLFDLKGKVSYGWKPIGGQWITLLFVYAALYVALFLSLGLWRFRRQAL